MRNLRPMVRWMGAVLMVLLAGVAVDAVRATPSRTLARELAAYASGDHPDAPGSSAIRAAVLVQPVDCTGNLRMLHLLHRPAVRGGIRLSVIWFIGAPGDSAVIRPLLPRWTATVPLQPAPAASLRELARLGHTSTPTLVVLDQGGR